MFFVGSGMEMKLPSQVFLCGWYCFFKQNSLFLVKNYTYLKIRPGVAKNIQISLFYFLAKFYSFAPLGFTFLGPVSVSLCEIEKGKRTKQLITGIVICLILGFPCPWPWMKLVFGDKMYDIIYFLWQRILCRTILWDIIVRARDRFWPWVEPMGCLARYATSLGGGYFQLSISKGPLFYYLTFQKVPVFKNLP